MYLHRISPKSSEKTPRSTSNQDLTSIVTNAALSRSPSPTKATDRKSLKSPAPSTFAACYESANMPDATEIHGGYAQTKWVAEQIIWAASKLDVPVTIHRPGRITGDSRSGVANLDDMLYLVLKGCIQVEAFPDIVWNIDMAPVDWVANVITTICSSPTLYQPGKAYHIMSKNFVPLTELFEWFVTRGFALKKLSYKDWRSLLMADREAAMSNAVYTLLPLLDEASDADAIVMPKVDCTNVDTAMSASGVRCPDISHELLEIYLQYFIKSGFLHPQQSLKLTAVRIGSYEISGGRFDRHVNFVIQVNFGTTSWKVKKRYKDFSKLETEISKEFETQG